MLRSNAAFECAQEMRELHHKNEEDIAVERERHQAENRMRDEKFKEVCSEPNTGVRSMQLPDLAPVVLS